MIFVDTWAWVALAIKRDQYHSIAIAQHQRFRNPKRKYVTTDYIISELISSLFRAGPLTLAQGYVQALLRKVDTGDYLLVHVTSDQFRRAWAMRRNITTNRTSPSSISPAWSSCRTSAFRTCSPATLIFCRSI